MKPTIFGIFNYSSYCNYISITNHSQDFHEKILGLEGGIEHSHLRCDESYRWWGGRVYYKC